MTKDIRIGGVACTRTRHSTDRGGPSGGQLQGGEGDTAMREGGAQGGQTDCCSWKDVCKVMLLDAPKSPWPEIHINAKILFSCHQFR